MNTTKTGEGDGDVLKAEDAVVLNSIFVLFVAFAATEMKIRDGDAPVTSRARYLIPIVASAAAVGVSSEWWVPTVLLTASLVASVRRHYAPEHFRFQAVASSLAFLAAGFAESKSFRKRMRLVSSLSGTIAAALMSSDEGDSFRELPAPVPIGLAATFLLGLLVNLHPAENSDDAATIVTIATMVATTV